MRGTPEKQALIEQIIEQNQKLEAQGKTLRVLRNPTDDQIRQVADDDLIGPFCCYVLCKNCGEDLGATAIDWGDPHGIYSLSHLLEMNRGNFPIREKVQGKDGVKYLWWHWIGHCRQEGGITDIEHEYSVLDSPAFIMNREERERYEALHGNPI